MAAAMMLLSCSDSGNGLSLRSKYVALSIDTTGYVTSIKSRDSGKDYTPQGRPSPLLTLYVGNDKPIYPTSARFDKNSIILSYPSGAVATVEAIAKDEYLTFRLTALANRGEIDNVVWGPYNTTIRERIGDIIAVVSDDDFAIGVFGTEDNTITGLPSEGDLYQMFYYVHSPDPVKYPLPDSLSEGQQFRIGGDGINDVAFFSHPEEYYYLNAGSGAIYDPSFGSSIVMHARDRRRPQAIFFTLLPGFENVNRPRTHDVETIDVDLLGSSIVFYGCPVDKTLDLLEGMVIAEGLPYVTTNGKWIRDPESFRTDMAWWGRHDSLISYANQLGIKAVQDEGLGEYYANPGDRWAGKKIRYGGAEISIADFTKMTNEHGIAYGLHTLCEFLQPHCSDVSPVPSDSLCLVLRTTITNDLSPTDKTITVADTSHLGEFGTWHANDRNVLKIGKELLTYEGVTKTPPYTLQGVTRGAYGTKAQAHKSGDMLGKLQMNCYKGFVPDMNLQDDYADYYARLLVDGGMNYVDFDGQESFMYQGHGQYAFKRFYRNLIAKFREHGGDYLRVMGSGIMDGNWLYMSTGNVGGGNIMFNPVTNEWGIEGKDVRNCNMNSFLPPTFGIQNFNPEWNVQAIENMQSKAIAWDAMYMLGLSEEAVEKNPNKAAIFKAFRTWEDARAANVFPRDLKLEMRDPSKLYHLDQTSADSWTLRDVAPDGVLTNPRNLTPIK